MAEFNFFSGSTQFRCSLVSRLETLCRGEFRASRLESRDLSNVGMWCFSSQ